MIKIMNIQIYSKCRYYNNIIKYDANNLFNYTTYLLAKIAWWTSSVIWTKFTHNEFNTI